MPNMSKARDRIVQVLAEWVPSNAVEPLADELMPVVRDAALQVFADVTNLLVED